MLVVQMVRERVERALAIGGRPVQRLGTAGTSVTFRINSSDEQSFTLLMDRDPVAAVDGTEPAEITIELTEAQAAEFAEGKLIIPTSVLSGTVSYRGPVRKYLPFDPILRALLIRVARDS